MDGVAFFSTSLSDVPLKYPPVGEGICASHNQPDILYSVNREHICRGCALMRQAYRTAKGESRLGLGSYMLLAPSGISYWGTHLLPSPIKRHSATGALRKLVRSLILTPPEPPWMFVAFARSNSPERLRVNSGNDLMYFSGKFLFPGTMDEPPVERLNRARVLALRTAAELTKKEWEECARAQAGLAVSSEALAFLRGIYDRFPALASLQVPTAKTPELNALRLLAEDT